MSNYKFIESGKHDFWRMPPGNVKAFSSYFEALKGLPKANDNAFEGHPRYFSGAVHEMALNDFEKGGLWCPGVHRQRHKVDLSKERIAFNHIIPFARGGGGSESNVQILCEACNLQKRATALGNAAL